MTTRRSLRAYARRVGFHPVDQTRNVHSLGRADACTDLRLVGALLRLRSRNMMNCAAGGRVQSVVLVARRDRIRVPR